MKKTYMAPTMEIEQLRAADIIATSLVNNALGDTNQLGRELEWEEF